MKRTGNKSFLLDTNIVIDLFRGHENIADKINSSYSIFLPVFVLGELYLGAEYSERKEFHYAQIEKLIQIAEILNTSNQTSLIYGNIKSVLKRNGTPIPENDIWIAALCREHNLPLVSNDVHFKLIPNIKIVSW